MKIDEMVNCAWHKPGMALVNLKTGVAVTKEMLDRIAESPQKRMLFESHGMCNPCTKTLLGPERYAVLIESLMD